MNGNPNAAQKRFHTELREMTATLCGGNGELHYIVGSKRNIYKYERAGEWLVLLIHKESHDNIKKLGFQWEQKKFKEQKNYYENYFGKPYPVPEGLFRSFTEMKTKQQVMKGFSPWSDDV